MLRLKYLSHSILLIQELGSFVARPFPTFSFISVLSVSCFIKTGNSSISYSSLVLYPNNNSIQELKISSLVWCKYFYITLCMQQSVVFWLELVDIFTASQTDPLLFNAGNIRWHNFFKIKKLLKCKPKKLVFR